jgi:hypothetical protein
MVAASTAGAISPRTGRLGALGPLVLVVAPPQGVTM